MSDARPAESDETRAAGAGDRSGSARATSPAPDNWAFPLFVSFGAAQILAGIVMFFAYNWRELPDLVKVALPQAALALGFLVYAAGPRRSALGAAAAILATVMIGVSMAVVGQVYQQGADPWRLFAVWAAFALPLALVARNDAHFAVWFAIATAAYFLYAEEYLRPQFEAWQTVPAIYAYLAFFTLVARDVLAAPFAGPAPRWQRWYFGAAFLYAAGSAGVSEALAERPFAHGAVGSATLFALAVAALVVYGRIRPDRPMRALALFALAVWVAAFGVRTIWRMKIEGAGEIAFAFLLSAVLVAAVTALLAFALRPRKPRGAAS